MSDSISKTYTYYPGCSQMITNKAYDISTRSVAECLGIELIELDDWNCCGATAYVAIREKRSFVLAARNLALAEASERELVTPCSACYVVLRKLNKYMKENSELRSEIRRALQAGGMDYSGTVRVRHFLDIVVNEVGEEEITSKVVNPLSGLKVAPYYGCQITRPFGEIDHEEFPVALDRLVEWLGGDVVQFPLKTKCCGGFMMTTMPDVGEKLSGKILKLAKERGADCIVTCCPMCQMNLEGYQKAISSTMETDCSLPVLYFTQLTGSALGLDNEQLALSKSLTPVEEMFTAKVAGV